MSKLNFLDEKWSWKITLSEFLKDNTPIGWEEFFERKDVKEELNNISEYLKKEADEKATIYPEIYQVFRAFRLPLKKIKVVILGQDCYHDGNAVGLCFSVPPNRTINPSLRNIYKELKDSGYSPIENGNLSKWVNQGCFLINTALTVEKASPGEHLHIWYPFSRKLLKYVSDNTENVIWLIMGVEALKISEEIDNPTHTKIISSHPSPLSANRDFRGYPAFLGSKNFLKINEFLKSKNMKEIDW